MNIQIDSQKEKELFESNLEDLFFKKENEEIELTLQMSLDYSGYYLSRSK